MTRRSKRAMKAGEKRTSTRSPQMGDPGPTHLLQLVGLRDGDVWELDGHPRRGFLLAAEEAADEVGECWAEGAELACGLLIWWSEEGGEGRDTAQ